jgi:hypothetical protein
MIDLYVFNRPAAVYALNYGLLNAKTDDDVVTVLQFIRDTELWVPGLFLSL